MHKQMANGTPEFLINTNLREGRVHTAKRGKKVLCMVFGHCLEDEV